MPCFVFAGFTLAFALQLRKNQGKTLSQGSHTYDPILCIPSGFSITQRPLSRYSGTEHGLSQRRQNEVIFRER